MFADLRFLNSGLFPILQRTSSRVIQQQPIKNCTVKLIFKYLSEIIEYIYLEYTLPCDSTCYEQICCWI